MEFRTLGHHLDGVMMIIFGVPRFGLVPINVVGPATFCLTDEVVCDVTIVVVVQDVVGLTVVDDLAGNCRNFGIVCEDAFDFLSNNITN